MSTPPVVFKSADSYDESAYGNPYHNALRVVQYAFSGMPKSFFPAYHNENFARHVNVSGHLLPKSSSVTFSKQTVNAHACNIPNVAAVNLMIDKMVFRSSNPIRCDADTGYTADNRNFDLLNCLEIVKNSVISGSGITGIGGAQWKMTVSDLDYQVDDRVISIWYHTEATHITYTNEWWRWDSFVKITLPLVTTPSAIPGINTKVELYPGSDIVCDFTFTNFSRFSAHFGDSVSSASSKRNLWTERCALTWVTSTSVTDFGTPWVNKVVASPVLNKLRDDFKERVNDSWGDILPSSAFSAVDAVSKLSGSVDNNVLQTIYKIPDIAKAMPDLQAAVDLLGKLVRRDLSFATLRDIADLATSTHLQASFTWRPYYELIFKYWPIMATLLPTMLSDKHLEVAYGRFAFTISNDLGRSQVYLVTRTKVVVDITLSGLMSSAYTLDSLGVFPTPSRVWDLLPFTFVVNWFSGVNTMLRRLEVMGVSSLVPMYFVHTYTLTSPFTGAELTALGAVSTGDPSAGLKAFYRDVSRRPPFPRYSRFPFGVPTGFPSTGLLGSLIYQLTSS